MLKTKLDTGKTIELIAYQFVEQAKIINEISEQLLNESNLKSLGLDEYTKKLQESTEILNGMIDSYNDAQKYEGNLYTNYNQQLINRDI